MCRTPPVFQFLSYVHIRHMYIHTYVCVHMLACILNFARAAHFCRIWGTFLYPLTSRLNGYDVYVNEIILKNMFGLG